MPTLFKRSDSNSNLDIDFSEASEDVQDVHTLLQSLLNKFYPKLTYIFKDGEFYNGFSLGNTGRASIASGVSNAGSLSISDGKLQGTVPSSSGYNVGNYLNGSLDITGYTKLRFIGNLGSYSIDFTQDVSSMSGIVYLALSVMHYGSNSYVHIYIRRAQSETCFEDNMLYNENFNKPYASGQVGSFTRIWFE